MNTTALQGINSFQTLVSYTNTQTKDLLITGGILSFYLIVTMLLLKNNEPFLNVMSINSWIFFIISSLFYLANLTTPLLPLMFLFVAGIATLVNYSKP
jgi:hypothetical protein